MIRASAALHISAVSIFRPLIPVQLAGLAFVFGSAWWLGRREGRRLGLKSGAGVVFTRQIDETALNLRRPKRFWPNLILTALLMGGMVAGHIEPVVVFMVGLVLALWLNYPDLNMQRERIDAHSRAALMMAGFCSPPDRSPVS